MTKGIGSLYIRKGVKITSFLHGGAQERGRRASTENVPTIVGLGKAIEIATGNIEEQSRKLLALRDRTIDEVINRIPFVKLNGHRTQRLPGNVNFSFQYIEGESVLLMLDMKGVAASTGSACTSGSLDPSHILLAIGVPHELANGSLRLTFGEENTQEDIDYLLEVLVYCKPPFKNAGCVVEYLGRYTHRVAISNNRILKLENGIVTFKWRDYRDNNKQKNMDLTADEFIRRFLIHIMPDGFTKIRHYGLLSPVNKSTKLKLCKKLTNTLVSDIPRVKISALNF